MPAANRPSVGSSIAVIATIAWARMRRGKAFYVSAGLLMLPVLLAGIFGTPHHGRNAWEISVLLLTLHPLFLFIPALHCAGMLADELDDRTYTYLFTRPIPRWTLVIGKLLAVYLVLAIGFLTSVALSHMLASRGGLPTDSDRNYGLSRAMLATGLGVFASCSLAASLGAVFPKRPFAAVFAWILGVEMIIGSMPTVLARISLVYHVRRIAYGAMGEQAMTATTVGTSALRLLQLAAIFLAIGLWRLSRAEYRSET